MEVKINSSIMKIIVSKVIEKALCKKLGYDIDIQLNALSVTSINDKISLHTDIDVTLSTDEFSKIIKDNSLI